LVVEQKSLKIGYQWLQEHGYGTGFIESFFKIIILRKATGGISRIIFLKYNMAKLLSNWRNRKQVKLLLQISLLRKVFLYILPM
jgi:hypothetical protein